jgi:hypothetical protein
MKDVEYEAYKEWYKRTKGGTIPDPMEAKRNEFFNKEKENAKK